jgi:hypothetical protein
MGGVINQDGVGITALLQSFMHKFLHTEYLDAVLQLQCEPAFELRILDTWRPAAQEDGKLGNNDNKEDTRETFGASNVESKFSAGIVERHLGTLAAGQRVSVAAQVKVNLDQQDKEGLLGIRFPEGCKQLNGITVRAILKAYKMPTRPGDEFEKVTLCDMHCTIPIIDDVHTIQFDQAPGKWELRLTKQKVNLQCVVGDIFDFLNNADNFG